jgi:membrane-associated phospholipid phosphatase
MSRQSLPSVRALAVLAVLVAGVLAGLAPASARTGRLDAAAVLSTWYQLVLELVRHTPTYSPPVASRSFAYLGVTAWEVVASGDDTLVSLAGQLNGLGAVPGRDPGAVYDEAVAMQAALAEAVRAHFSNTGPTGQRAVAMVGDQLAAAVSDGLPADVVDRSAAHGRAVAAHVLAWSATDGGAVVENLGFPVTWAVSKEPGRWVPTNTQALQQAPLLPTWGGNRTFAMPQGNACPLPPPPPYSEEPGSAFHDEAMEVYRTARSLTDEQRIIARFWSDDPMLSPTPPGHWISIALAILDDSGAPVAVRADVLARLGVAMADAFIGCWYSKFEFDLIRPVTYIRKVIDPTFEPLLITPPFPEYPSGHSTQSGAAAAVLAAAFGADTAFVDATHEADGLAPRSFASFAAAAEEAALSRLYGGIHFRSAIERGLSQGGCIGAHAVALRTRTSTP